MVVHAELAERAGFSIDWTATSKADYLNALTQEIAQPGARHLDTYLKAFLRDPVGTEKLARHVINTRGLNGGATGENQVLGKVSDPGVHARYAAQRLQRRRDR